MIKLAFRDDPMNDQVTRVSAVLLTPDGEEYYIAQVEETDDTNSELMRLRDFVSYWSSAAEMMRIPLNIEAEVNNYGIELAMEVEV